MMTPPETYSFERYLDAKQSVDRRALNQRVERRFFQELRQMGQRQPAPLRVVELGAGLGPTAKRVIAALEEEAAVHLEYVLVDSSPEVLRVARERLSGWLEERGYSREKPQEANGRALQYRRKDHQIVFRFRAQELHDVVSRAQPGGFNAVIAQSVLDLTPVSTELAHIQGSIEQGGVFYSSLNFDGTTRFLPTSANDLTSAIVHEYHQSMRRETEHGTTSGPDTGRELLATFPTIGNVLAVGSSDWFVCPDGKNTYAEDEAYFLYHILKFVETEAQASPAISSEKLASWLTTRRRQVQQGELVFQAAQLDLLGRVG